MKTLRHWRTRLLSDSLLAVSLNHISGENLVQADVFHRSDLRLEVEGASVSKKKKCKIRSLYFTCSFMESKSYSLSAHIYLIIVPLLQIKYLSQTNAPPSERRGGKKQRGGKAAGDENSIILKKQKVKARKGNII